MSYQIQQALGFAIHQVDIQLKNELTRRLSPHDLTAEQHAVLAALESKDGASQRELGELLDKDRPNMTRLLEKLERKGLVRRQPSKKDRRVQHVHTSDKAKELRPKLEQILEEFRADAFRGISPAEQTMLYSQLKRMLRNLA